ncbi:MAG TPA: RtcB family protein, partial [Candidatus Ozemobacteraceae bacterium]|nr:RtcB family protein [Candidatus Ozemobacteraceae bacterium]
CRLEGLVSPDWHKLDNFIRRSIPLGMTSRRDALVFRQKSILAAESDRWLELCQVMERQFFAEYRIGRHTSPELQLATLGGGNHFIEVDRGTNGDLYLLIHSGSRNFGLRVAEHYQKRARDYTSRRQLAVPHGTEFLPIDGGGDEYLHWAQQAQLYARYNRRAMMMLILDFLGVPLRESNVFESVHNYISPIDQIVRKGAISAREDERVVIPLNMADGTIIGRGRSNAAYNFSAPHGAGRVHGRQEMKRMLASGTLTMQQYHASMSHVYSTSVSRQTIDESKFAYKPFDLIRDHLEATVQIEDHLTPVYNLKASED